MPKGIPNAKVPDIMRLALGLVALGTKEELDKVQKLTGLLQQRDKLNSEIEALAGMPQKRRGRKPGRKPEQEVAKAPAPVAAKAPVSFMKGKNKKVSASAKKAKAERLLAAS